MTATSVSWRHLDFFWFEAWLHAGGPRVGCTACGKTCQIAVPWARDGSGFTLLFQALALTMCQGLPVRQAARMLRVRDELGELDATQRRAILWGMRRNPAGWTVTQTTAMHWLQRANLKTARAGGSRWACARCSPTRVCTTTRPPPQSTSRWIGWARRSRLNPFKRLATTL